MPKGVADGMAAFRMANEGYALKNGDVMFKPDDISTMAITLQAIGMPSTDIKHMDWLKNQQYEIKKFYKDRTHEIEHEYEAAHDAGDTEKLAELRDQWTELQLGKDDMRKWFGDAHTELKRQPLVDLLKFPQAKAKRERALQKAASEAM